MYRIYLETIIETTAQRCFDLSRSIDFHAASMWKSKEIPVDGKITGLIELSEYVEWEATHFFVRQRLSSKITEMVKPYFFVDEQIKGAFKSFRHRHEIHKINDHKVMMTDDFRYEVPFSTFGKIANTLFLNRYMEKLLEVRNNAVKSAFESDEWRKYITE